MKRKSLLLYVFLLCGLVSCSSSNKSTATVLTFEKTDSCKSDPKNSYEVYMPARKNAADKLPLLVIIDAHGKGKFALDKFRQAARQYPAILVASDLIKNGFDGFEAAIQTLIEDVRQKYPVSETVYLTGFSGGARMALGYALTHQTNGLIMCGALASPDQIQAVHCPVISISGTDDFNFMETAQYLFNDQSTPANLKIELTNASHNWPDSVLLANTWGFLSMSGKTVGTPSLPRPEFKIYCQHQQARINLLRQQGDYLKATVLARNMTSTIPFNTDKTFAATYQALSTNASYINQMKQLQKCLELESSMRQPYIEDFQTKDTLWWKKEIDTTNEKIKTEQNTYTNDMYRRIKGFWGIACYSLCKQAINQQNAEVLNKVLAIYRMVEPENPDMFYFSAFPPYWAGNNEITLSKLKQAQKAGFSDQNQLKNNFPETIRKQL